MSVEHRGGKNENKLSKKRGKKGHEKNFEDYIDFVEEDNGILLYSGADFTKIIVKIKEELLKKSRI